MQTVKAQDDPDLVVLETDDILFKDPGFRYDGHLSRLHERLRVSGPQKLSEVLCSAGPLNDIQPLISMHTLAVCIKSSAV